LIPVSVLVVTRNEALCIGVCLAALRGFSEVIVIDSASADSTKERAAAHGAKIVDFVWNGAYPKKRQWCLDNLELAHDWVLFVDADEIITAENMIEIAKLFEKGAPACCGYFLSGQYVSGGRVLRHGLRNGKLALFNRRQLAFPVVNDLGLPLGEIEGHYQPARKKAFRNARIGHLNAPLLHYADCKGEKWQARHRKYAAWEAGMNRRSAWPADPVPARESLKRLFRAAPLRPQIAFAHSYFLKLGLLDGRAGYDFARSRAEYYRMVAREMKRVAV
jgi:glycosyltransferase involved in cell wall biosynthesis